MDPITESITEQAVDLAREGNMVEAIKLLRAHTGIGLAEAKEALEASLKGPAQDSQSSVRPAARHDDQLPAEAIEALHRGVLIDAIKHTRRATGMGLKDAKETVERYLQQHPDTRAQFKAAGAAEFRRVMQKLYYVAALCALVILGYLIATGKSG